MRSRIRDFPKPLDFGRRLGKVWKNYRVWGSDSIKISSNYRVQLNFLYSLIWTRVMQLWKFPIGASHLIYEHWKFSKILPSPINCSWRNLIFPGIWGLNCDFRESSIKFNTHGAFYFQPAILVLLYPCNHTHWMSKSPGTKITLASWWILTNSSHEIYYVN